MKLLLIALSLSITFAHASEPVRDLEKSPLTVNEAKAFKAAKRLAKIQGQAIREVCVNASFEAGTEPVSVQFYNLDAEGESCADPHYSIEVEMRAGKVIGVKLIDA